MSSTITGQNDKAKDRAITLRNRARLGADKNLLFWYRELYRDQFRDFPNPERLSILEIGSGTSPPELAEVQGPLASANIGLVDILPTPRMAAAIG